jgi:muramidase (phage lysozyme)
MDANALRGAEALLDFIGKVETGRTGIDAYRTIYGHKENTLPKPVTEFTLDELTAAQLRWGKNWGSSAAGKFQILRKTLLGLMATLKLSGDAKFSKKTQDMLGTQLLLGRGFARFASGSMTLEAFAIELAKEWASMPVLSAMQGASRKVAAGQSYYAGDGLNKALVTPTEFRAALEQCLALCKAASPRLPAEPPRVPPVEDYEKPVAQADRGGRPGGVAIAIIIGLALAVASLIWLLGGNADAAAPVPQERPFGLIGPSQSIWSEIALQAALAFVAPLAGAVATMAVGWVTFWWGKVLKSEFDARSAEQLHDALQRGLVAAADRLGARASSAKLLASAADYAERFNGGTVKRFGLTNADLQQLAAPHLPTVKR